MRRLFTLLTLLIAINCYSQQSVIIREPFSNNTGSYNTGNNSTLQIYFDIAIGATGTDPGGAMVAPNTGVTSMDSTPVNATYTTISEKGYIQDAHSSNNKLFYTTTNSNKYINQNPISRTSQELTRIKYATANNSTAWVIRFVAFASDGKPYALGQFGQQQTVASGGSDASAFATHSDVWDVAIDMTQAIWCPVTFTPGSELSIDTVNRVVFPAGSITGYGFYCSRQNALGSSVRIDGLELFVTPKSQTGNTLAVRETFFNTVANGYRTGATHGWALNMGTTDTAAKGAINAPFIGSMKTSNVPVGVNYTTTTDTGFYQNTERATIKLFYTTKSVSISRTGQDVAEIRWVSANNSDTWNMQAVIKIGANWFLYNKASIQDSANNSGDGSAFTSTKVYYWDVVIDNTAPNWLPLTHNPNVSLSVGTTAQFLPTGDITGYGLLYSRPTSSILTTRFDSYEIYTKSGIPITNQTKIYSVE